MCDIWSPEMAYYTPISPASFNRFAEKSTVGAIIAATITAPRLKTILSRQLNLALA
jgi:hypothetical protein